MDRDRAIEIVTAEAIKSSVKNHIADDKELDEEEKELLLSLLRTISYYSLKKDYDEYYAENKEAIDIALGSNDVTPNSFTVTCVEENMDGSANIEVELGSGIREILLSEGMNFLLIKGMLNGTTSDMLAWSTRGKELAPTIHSTETLDEEVKTLYT